MLLKKRLSIGTLPALRRRAIEKLTPLRYVRFSIACQKLQSVYNPLAQLFTILLLTRSSPLRAYRYPYTPLQIPVLRVLRRLDELTEPNKRG